MCLFFLIIVHRPWSANRHWDTFDLNGKHVDENELSNISLRSSFSSSDHNNKISSENSR